ncbi:MAG TPA: hypothetical protein VKD72_27885, partial [Gemmataceae bacterium]|nr:hypothetical protein [Gemmataceae bacterium]
YPPGGDFALFLVKVTTKDGKAEGKVLSTPVTEFEKPTVEEIKVSDKTLTMKVKAGPDGPVFNFNFLRGKDEKKLVGSGDFGRGPRLARCEKTEDTEIKEADAQKPFEGGADLVRALQKKDAKGKAEALKEFAEKAGDSPAGYYARLELVTALAATGATSEVLRAELDRAAKLAEGYDPAIKETTLSQADTLEVRGLKGYVADLKKDGKAEELKAAESRLDKIEKKLDDEYLKTAIPFKPEPFKGRRGKSDRVVVLELFTGAECPPCVAADVAFDALVESFKPTEVVLLQYHLHIPRPDALTNKDSEKRQEFYGRHAIPGTPTFLIDGEAGPPVGGGKGDARPGYEELVKQLAKAVETEPQAKLTLSAQRKGEAVEIVADVADLKKPGEDVKLRLLLVEEAVRYPGGNGQRFHHHIVRAFPGGVDGMALKEATGKQNVKVNLKDLAKDLNEYLEDFAANQGRFSIDDRPMELKNLKVVAFVQNDRTKEIYQAAQVDLGEGK